LFCGQLSAGFSVKNSPLFERSEFGMFRKRQRKVAKARYVVIFVHFLSRKSGRRKIAMLMVKSGRSIFIKRTLERGH